MNVERAVRILDDLKGHGDGRTIRFGDQFDSLAGTVVSQGLILAIERRGEIAHYGVQKRLHALVPVGGAEEHRG